MYKEFVDKEGYNRSISVGDGWDHLVKPLLEELEQLGGAVLQVKEKFGGLRFYYRLSNDHPQALAFGESVEKAEAQSFDTCEECGQPGELRSGKWLVTLCNHDERIRQAKIAAE